MFMIIGSRINVKSKKSDRWSAGVRGGIYGDSKTACMGEILQRRGSGKPISPAARVPISFRHMISALGQPCGLRSRGVPDKACISES